MFGKVLWGKDLAKTLIKCLKILKWAQNFKSTVSDLSQNKVAAFELLPHANIPYLFVNEDIPPRELVEQIYLRFDTLGGPFEHFTNDL